MTLLLIIDLQNQFINSNTKNCIKDISNLVIKNKFDKVLFTKFINDINNNVYRKLHWDGCISEESTKISIDIGKNKVIEKNTYSAFNEELKRYIDNNNIDKIFLCGIDIECCVMATAFDLFDNNFNVYILKDYCYSTYGIDKKNNAIEILKRNIGENYIV